MLLPLLLQLDHDRLASRGRHSCVLPLQKTQGFSTLYIETIDQITIKTPTLNVVFTGV